MDTKSLPIGVFDSGVGGITVVKEIFKNLPNEKIIYFGDTARVPYGNKSPETVIRYSKQIAQFLVSQGVKAIVIACNTASALALDAVREVVSVPVIGVVLPGAEAAANATKNGNIGIIGTNATIKSGLYEKSISETLPTAKTFGQACPLFCNLVEEKMIDDEVTIMMIHRYMDDLVKNNKIDTLVLGCTHYPILESVIKREVGEGITLVNPAYETAKALEKLLSSQNLLNTEILSDNSHTFYVSDDAEHFRTFASDILELETINTNLAVLS